MNLKIVIQEISFEPYQAITDYQQGLAEKCFGACTTFVGTMRDFNDGDQVQSMFLEHYPGMTENKIRQICETANEKWPLLDLLVIHRVGHIQPGEPIVLIATWAEHRSAAFNASRFIINELKTHAPFWKCEQTNNRKKWVAKNTDDTVES